MADNVTSWFSDLGTIAGIIGASAWLSPLVYEKFTKPIVEGRLISHFSNKGKFKESECLLNFLAINLISLKKSFNIKETKISVRYKGGKDIYSGSLFWARKNSWTLADGGNVSLNISPEHALPFLSTLPKNITTRVYLTFRVDKAELEEFDEIVITFIDHSKHESKIVINFSEINGDQMLWDDRIWEENT